MRLLGTMWNNHVVNREKSARSNGYTWSTTAEEVVRREGIDCTGKNIVVTGANRGLGFESARVLAKFGAHVYMVCRDLFKGEEAAERIRQVEGPQVRLTVLHCDVSKMDSVRRLADDIHRRGIPLHVLMLNAGICAIPYTETEDGLEKHFATHVASNFLLVQLLLPRLQEGVPSRILFVSSTMHRFSCIDPNDINGKGTWYTNDFIGRWTAYCRSKSGMILLASELQRRLEGTGVEVYVCHPGSIITGIQRHQSWPEYLTQYIPFEVLGLGKTVAQGAATQVYLCVSPQVKGLWGSYFSDCNVAEPEPYATDPIRAGAVYEVCAKVTGMTHPAA